VSRAAYSLDREQIDGAFSFDTDDYILEAHWRQEPIGREHLDVFRSKISRKGKNALALYKRERLHWRRLAGVQRVHAFHHPRRWGPHGGAGGANPP